MIRTGLCTRLSPADAALRGLARWRALAEGALADLGGRRDVPIIVGSCNGAAEDAASWPRAFAGLSDYPVASGACASGLQALWVARAFATEVIVLAVDIRSQVSREHFAALRVLDDHPAPWQPDSAGFVQGEAAVAIRMPARIVGPTLVGPILGPDLGALVRALPGPDFIIGQGTGPAAVDDAELAALPADIPLATALLEYGHTLGASGLLSLALALRRQSIPMPLARATDGRPLGIDGRGVGLVACRALGGACAAVVVGAAREVDGREVDGREVDGREVDGSEVDRREVDGSEVDGREVDRREVDGREVGGREVGGRSRAWGQAQAAPPMRLPILRAIGALPRPARCPAAIVVRLDAPLVPDAPDASDVPLVPDALAASEARGRASRGRLLPSTILEITPGFIAQLLARVWGFLGPSICLVGGSDAAWMPTLAAIRAAHGEVLVLHVHERDFEWGT